MKYQNIKKLVLLAIFLQMGYLCKAQTGPLVQIKDLTFIEDFSSNDVDTSKVPCKLFFKINNAVSATHATLLFGTDKDLGNILNVQMPFVHGDGKDSIQYLNQTNLIASYTAYMSLQMTKSQAVQIKWLTLYVVDRYGNNSTNLYYKVNP